MHVYIKCTLYFVCAGIDTRELTKKIREEGTMLGRVVLDYDQDEEFAFVDPNTQNLVQMVSCQVCAILTCNACAICVCAA